MEQDTEDQFFAECRNENREERDDQDCLKGANPEGEYAGEQSERQGDRGEDREQAGGLRQIAKVRGAERPDQSTSLRIAHSTGPR